MARSRAAAMGRQVLAHVKSLPWSSWWTRLEHFHIPGPQPVRQARTYLRCHIREAAVAASAALFAGSVLIGVSNTPLVPGPDAISALNPLADTIEVVSRRNMADLTSRTMTAHLLSAASTDEGTDPTLAAANESNVTLILTWDPALVEAEPEAQFILRRGLGDAAPLTPAEGVDVPLGDDPGVVKDTGLQPDTAYSYTLFIQRSGEKPEVLAQIFANTSLYPTELLPDQILAAGDRLASPSNNHFLAVTENGAVVLLNNRNQKLWSLDAPADPAAQLTLNADGSLTVRVGANATWTAKTSAPAAKLVLSDGGVLQLLAADGSVVWSSKDHGHQLRGDDSTYRVSADGWTQPGAGPIDSPFGVRIHPIYGGYRQHNGVDMTSKRGAPIFAAHDGQVVRVYQDSGGNWTIEISHSSSISTRYLHMYGLQDILVQEGDKVVAGEQIARVGSSGQSTGPHLHFEVIINGAATDPIPFLAQHGITIQ
ncbi:MAG: peptidoglycan DD-metalloendopeptidase family protein [Bifidobacteriaceae bacterium]|nr:peptidoglycan DD-metalloendopeptidase family protein [Bifidobacteriaceae bacterium]